MRAALDIILAGKSERAAKARKLGLIDELVHPAILRDVALRGRLATGAGRASGALAEAAAWRDGCSMAPRRVVRSCIAWRGSSCWRRPAGTTRRHWRRWTRFASSLSSGMEAGLAYEALRFGELAVTDVSRNLVGIFFATTALKKDDGVPPGTVGTLPPVARIGVVGAGFMGAGIAGTAALNAEVEVRHAATPTCRASARASGRRRGILDERLKRKRLTRPEHQRLDRARIRIGR